MRYVLLAVGAVVLLASPARAGGKRAINAAIDRGVAGLKKLQDNNGSWPSHDGMAGSKVGATALAALTLLECDVPKNHKLVQKAAKFVREESLELTQTYSLALAIL